MHKVHPQSTTTTFLPSIIISTISTIIIIVIVVLESNAGTASILLVSLISPISRSIRITAQIRLWWSGDLRGSTNLTSMIAHGQVRVLLHNSHQTFVSLTLFGLFLRNALLTTECLPPLQVLNLTSGTERTMVSTRTTTTPLKIGFISTGK